MRSAIATRGLGLLRLASGLSVLVLAGCLSLVEIPIDTPLESKLDVTGFKRLLVAGFVVEQSGDVELQTETVHLLQNHLRANGKLRVLEPDHPPLEDALAEIDKRLGPSQVQSKAEREQRRQETDRVLQDAEFWRRLGEEYQQPLIISGRIGFEGRDRSGFEEEERAVRDVGGVPYDAAQRRYAHRRGYTLTADFHFVDGRTGQTLHKERFTEEVLYSEEHAVSALAAYFELMDRLLPNVLGVISTQRIQGTRSLLY